MDYFSPSQKRFKSGESMPTYSDAQPLQDLQDIVEILNDASPPPPPTPPTAPAAPAAAPELPRHYIQIGKNVLVGVSTFLNRVQVHIRQYIVKDGCFVATKDGICMPPSVWENLRLYLELMHLGHNEDYFFVCHKIFLSTVVKPVPTLYMQTVYHARSNGAMQLSQLRMQFDREQLDRLRVCGELMQDYIANELFGVSFKKAVWESDTFPLLDPHTMPKFHTTEARTRLLDGVCQVTREALTSILKGYGLGRDNDNECALQASIHFNNAVTELDMRSLATAFVWKHPELYHYITADFLDTLHGSEIINLAKRTLLNDGF